MLKISSKFKNLNGIFLSISKRNISNEPKEPCVVMSNDNKHIVCYHPEPEHPFSCTKAIERKLENETILKDDYANLYIKRFDDQLPTSQQDHWVDAIRLAKTFNEHPIIFKRANRNERIKKYLEKVKPIKKNRESI